MRIEAEAALHCASTIAGGGAFFGILQMAVEGPDESVCVLLGELRCFGVPLFPRLSRHSPQILKGFRITLAIAGSLSALFLVLSPHGGRYRALACEFCALCYMFRCLRSRLARDASDGMNIIVLTAAAMGEAAQSVLSLRACMIFIVLQSCLAYGSAGVAKARSVVWRSGSAIQRILRTREVGLVAGARFFDRSPLAARLACWGVIVLECGIPFSVFLPQPFLFAVLVLGLAMHVSVAIVMGLGGFLWVFAATYPAIVWLNASMRGQ